MSRQAAATHRIRYCPVCGADSFSPITFVEKGGLRLPSCFTCSTCEFRYFVNPAASTVAILEVDEQHIVMIRRAREPYRGTLDLPGGFIDRAETARAALEREVFEETGLRIVSCRSFEKTYTNEYLFDKVLYSTLDLPYVCRVEDISQLRTNDPHEGEPLVININQIEVSEVGLPSVRRFLTDYLTEVKASGDRAGE